MRQPFRCDADGRLGSSDPKPREGTETAWTRASCRWSGRSSDPKPREGTETRQQSRRPARMTPVVRPKTPRGDGNLERVTADGTIETSRQTQNPERGRKPHGPGRAADGPGGRQTQNPERGRKLDCANWLGADPGGRQTQNPERGRKLHIDFLDLARREDHVVRPKTPREDGNSSTIASMSMSQSSSRQTQNPERGRKLGACHRRRHD
ncbi:Uncharacterised protein [Mycobacterium tuberculosis]|nr:Uncharacterised protein [Mycobacterium tuberculosis]